jgi:AcrR family transcriptional regulator
MSSTTSTPPASPPAFPPAATPGDARATTRDRLLDAAGALFYSEGIVAVGVDRICQQAGVSKRSLYKLFETKDDLVAAALRRFGDRLEPAYRSTGGTSAPGRARILAVFTWLEELAATEDYEGCPFVATATELKDGAHPASVVAREFKQRLTDLFEREATIAGANDPALLAQELTVTFDGCGARRVVTGHPLNGLAVTMATTLLDSAGATA